jgi:hypothetical protein
MVSRNEAWGSIKHIAHKHMNYYKLWIGELGVGGLASLFIWCLFALADNWVRKQCFRAIPVVRGFFLMLIFIPALEASCKILSSCHISQDSMITYHPIWMVPFLITSIFSVIRTNNISRKAKITRCLERVGLTSSEQFLFGAPAIMVEGVRQNSSILK